MPHAPLKHSPDNPPIHIEGLSGMMSSISKGAGGRKEYQEGICKECGRERHDYADGLCKRCSA